MFIMTVSYTCGGNRTFWRKMCSFQTCMTSFITQCFTQYTSTTATVLIDPSVFSNVYVQYNTIQYLNQKMLVRCRAFAVNWRLILLRFFFINWCMFVYLMVFNATFNTISAISWRNPEDLEKTTRPATSHWQTLSHNAVQLALIEIRTHNMWLHR